MGVSAQDPTKPVAPDLPAAQLSASGRRPLLPLPADHTSFVTISDPVPWMRAVLQDPHVVMACRGTPLGDAFKILGGIQDPHPRRVGAVLDMVAPQLPEELTLAVPPEAVGSVGALLRGILLLNLSAAVFQLDDENAARKRLTQIQGEVLDCFEELSRLRAALHLEYRDERAAELAFESSARQLDALAAQLSFLTLHREQDALRLVLAPAAGFDEDEFAELLDATTLIWGTDDPWVRRCWQWLQRTQFTLVVRQRERELSFVLESPRRAQAGRRRLPEIPTLPGANIECRFALDASALKPSLDKVLTTWRKWRKTDVGRIALRNDTERFLAEIEPLVASTARAARTCAGAVGWSARGVEWAIDEAAVDTVDLRRQRILQLLPARCFGYSFDGARSLADLLIDVLAQIDGRIIAAEAETSEQQGPADDMLRRYFQRTDPFRELLLTEARSAWIPPVAVFGTPGGVLTLGVENGASLVYAAPGLVMVGRCKDARSGLPLARRLFEALADGLLIDPTDVAAVLDADLGLGVPTVSLPMSLLLKRSFGAVRCSDALLPHAFVVDGLLVVSTSVEASKSVLASARAKQGPTLPGADRLIGASATTGPRLAVMASWFGEITAMAHHVFVGPQDRQDPGWTGVAITGNAIASALRLLGPLASTTVAENGLHRTRGSIGFRRTGIEPLPPDLLAGARRALGEPPSEVLAFRARGSSRYIDLDGTFSFTFAEDGRLVTRIESLCPESNGFDGHTAWGTNENWTPRTVTDSDRDWLGAFAMILSGRWTDPSPEWEVGMASDVLPTEPPMVLLRARGSGRTARLQLDPTTSLVRSFDLRGQCTPVIVSSFEPSDFRAVEGRMLPHRIASHDGAVYRVDAWEALRALDEAAFARPPEPEDTSFEGEPAAEVEILHRRMIAKARGPGGEAWLVVDPAETRLRMSASGAQKLGFVQEPGAEWAMASELRIGPMTMRGIPVSIEPTEPMPGEERVVGQIGWSLFRRCCAELDQAGPALRLFPRGAFADRDAPFVPVRTEFRSVLVPVAIDRRTEVAFQLSFHGLARLHFLNRLDLDEALFAGREVRLLGAYSSMTGCLGSRLTGASIGGVGVGETIALLPRSRLPDSAQGSGSGCFGWELLQQHVLVLDLAADRVAFVARK